MLLTRNSYYYLYLGLQQVKVIYYLYYVGCGKTHYIKSELKEKGLPYVVITVDESFSADRAIRKLRSLENYEGPNSIYFNFTLIFPTVGS